VKIQSKTIRKRYGRGKGEYSYKQHMLPFPIKENEALEPFLKKELRFKMNIKDGSLYITLETERPMDKYEKKETVTSDDSHQ
jgi:hypothetical protein